MKDVNDLMQAILGDGCRPAQGQREGQGRAYRPVGGPGRAEQKIIAGGDAREKTEGAAAAKAAADGNAAALAADWSSSADRLPRP